MNPDEVKANVAKLVAAGAPDQDIHDYLEAAGFPQSGQPATAVAPHLPTKLELAQRDAAQPHPEDLEAPDASYAQQALGGISALARDIPGAEAVQAGARSLFRGQSYTDALSDIRGAEDSAPQAARIYNRLAGGTIAAALAPGSSALAQGAGFGVASGLLSADPSSMGDRLGNTVKEGLLGAAAGKIGGEVVPLMARKVLTPALDKAALLRNSLIRDADTYAYGRAASEANMAAANPTPQAITDAFDDPDVKPYVDAIVNSSAFQHASPGTIINEAYKLMSERQGKLGLLLTNSTDFKAGSSLEHAEITAAKQKLLAAADQIGPAFRSAVEGHAKLAGERDAFEAARDATGNILKGKAGTTKNLETKSPAAFMQSIFEMKPGEANAARQGLLGQVKDAGLPLSPIRAMARSGRVAPYLNALDKQASGAVNIPSLLRAAAISGGLLGH